MKAYRFLLIALFVSGLLHAEDIPKKIKDIEIDTMKYLSTDDIQKKYDPTTDARGHLYEKPQQHIGAGYSSTSGNTHTSSFNAKYTFSHNTQFYALSKMSYTLEASAFMAKDHETRTAEEYKIFFNAKQPLPKKWLSYLSIGWLKNDFQNFSNKVDLSIGLGKILLGDTKQSLTVKLGPAVNYEAYTSGGNNSYTSLNEYIEYQRRIRKENKFYIKVGAKENFADMKEDYELNSLIGLQTAIVDRLDLTIEYNAFYDHLPSEGFKKTDTKTVVRLGYDF